MLDIEEKKIRKRNDFFKIGPWNVSSGLYCRVNRQLFAGL